MTDATTAPTTKLTKDKVARTYHLSDHDIVLYDDADHSAAFTPTTMDVLWTDGVWERTILRGRAKGDADRQCKATWRWSDGDAPEWVTPQLTDDVLSKEQQQKIKNAFGRMPYAGGLYVGAGFATVEQVVEKLDALAAKLRDVAHREGRMDAELVLLRQQKATLGEFILSAVESAAELRDLRERVQ